MTLHTSVPSRHSNPRWALLKNASIRYTFAGNEGRPLLLLHEMGGSLESWDPVLELMAADRRIIRCDVRGSGGSEKIRAPVSLAQLADDIVSLLDHISVTDAVDVAGVAIGGCLGLTLAARYPKRIHRLAAINPPTDATGRSGEVLRERAALADAHGMRGVVESALGRSYPDFLRTDEHAYQAYVARFLCNDPTSYAHILRALTNVDFEGVLETITCPTTFISGRHDLVRRSEDIEEIAKRVKGASFLQIEGGHIPSVQAPESLANALEAFFD
ncbi:alpha/beta fold hydrolase [Paraburkholderia sp. SIMBA_030]|uniref:alpha/beta fold hydrolase n=2 Tax=Bacteria TaxID=2 RepID=UPI00397D7EA8